MRKMTSMILVLCFLSSVLGACAPASRPVDGSKYVGETANGQVTGTIIEITPMTANNVVMTSVRLKVTETKLTEVPKGIQLLGVVGADAVGLKKDEKATFSCHVIYGGTASQSVTCQLFKTYLNE